MARISTYEVVPVPKLADKLIGTSVGGEIEDITYNFTLLELLNLFLPIIPANNLQGVLDYGNTATQDIVLYGTIYTTNLEVTNTATLLDSYLNGDTNVLGALYDVNGSKGLAAQVLTSTGNYVEWVTLPPIFTPNLQQVLTVGNTANLDIILTANIQALDINVNTATVNNNITIDGTITDGYSSVGTLNQVLSSTGTDIKWVNLPVYSATSPLFLDSITGIFSIQQSNGTQNGYLSAADWITFNGKQNAGNYITALTGEATATGPGSVAITLSNPAVTGKVLTGLSITGGSISAADSILSAFGKVQNQLNGLVGGVMFKGVWNAFTNTPTLTSSIGTQGWYYIVDVAGTTNLNGITDWQVGDWAIFNGSTWNKIDNTDLVTSVNGQVGAVSLTTDDISEGSLNLYFTDTRARNSVSATTPLAYNNISGVFSIQVATTSQDGYLTSTDWTTFNSKQNALSGTGLVKSTSGTITYITDNSSNWNTAYNDSIVSAAVTGTSTKTLTLNQQDGGTITASWSDIDTGLTSVGLSMPVAFSVANTPLISNGTLAVTAIGTATQYIRGDGQLATLPTGGSGGSSVFYYLNGSIAASVATYKQMSNTAIIGAGTDFNLSGNGLIAQFLTDVGNPNRLEIPGGAWNFEMFFSMSSSGGTPQFYVELLKYDGAVFTSIASSSIVPETISGGTATDLYLTSLAVPTTTLLLTDRLAVRVYIVNNSGGRTATLHTEDGNLCQIITTFSAGISAINGLTSNNQYLAVGTAGIDFAINSLLETHTFNLPTSSAINRGALSSADWTTFNDKLSTTTAASTYIPYTGATTNVDLGTNFLFSDYGKFYRGILMSQSGGGYSATGYTGISASGTNGVTFNTITQANILSFNSSALRTYTFPDDSGTVALVGGAGVGTVTSVAALTLGTTGTDLSSTVANSTTTPVITLNVPTASASNRGALSSTDWTTFNSKQASGSYITSLTGEATGLGPGATAVTLNNASVTAKILTGVNITGGTVVATDTMLTAFGKLQNQINGLIGGSIYQGTWDASTNTPILTSSVGTQGYYYIVSVAGTTNLNGITDWFVGDWAIFNGGVWQQVDNTDSVVSVNGQTGAVSLTTDNISEGTTNLYFTNLRARAAITLTTTGTSGASTYNSTTGALNIPQYQDVLTNPVTGSGGANFVPKFTSASIIANSQIYDNGTGVGVGITTLGAYFDVNGTGRFSGALTFPAASKMEGSAAPNFILASTSTAGSGNGPYQIFRTNSSDFGYIGSEDALMSTTGNKLALLALNGLSFRTGSSYLERLSIASTGAATFSSSVDATVANLSSGLKVTGSSLSSGTGAEIVYTSGKGLFLTFNRGAGTYLPTEIDGSTVTLSISGTPKLTIASTGNVGIGTTTDAGYKLDVNGTGRFSGQLTLSSTLSNGTYIYTLPSATGTLALTSALSGYLPLTGGTLTGALNGTSATLSSFLTVSGITTLNAYANLNRLSNTGDNTIHYQTASSDKFYMGLASGSDNWRLYSVSSGNNAFTINATTDAATFSGALFGTSATFSSLLTANSGTTNNTNAITIAAATSAKTHIGAAFGATFLQNNNYYNGSAYVFDDNTIGSSTITLGETIAFQTGAANTAPSTKLTIASTGAATFNSTIQTKIQLNASSNEYSSLAFANNSGTSKYEISKSNTDDLYFYSIGVGYTMMLKNNGNVLIGTTTDAGYKLDVNGTGRFTGALGGTSATFSGLITGNSFVNGTSGTYKVVTNASATLGYLIRSGTWKGSAENTLSLAAETGFGISFFTDGSATERLTISSTGAATFSSNLTVSSGRTELKGISDIYSLGLGYSSSASALFYIGVSANTSPDLIFSNGSPSEKMRITSGGNVLIGTTTDNGFKQRVDGGASNNGNSIYANGLSIGAQSNGSDYPALGYNIKFTSTSALTYVAADYASWIKFGSGKVETFTATASSGTISPVQGPYVANTGTSWTNGSSDERLKKNFEPTQGLAEILQINPVKYHFKTDNDSSVKRLGFIAQNLKPLIPEMVVEKDDLAEDGSHYLTITPDYLLPVLTKAIQELNKKLDELSAKNEALIKRIETLENK